MTSERLKYAREAIVNITGIPEVFCGNDLLQAVFDELSREEEVRNPSRDSLGRWDHTFCGAYSEGRLLSPWIDEAALQLRAQAAESDIEPLWPDGRPFALCLTHDVDVVSRKSYLQKFGRRMLRAMCATGARKTALIDGLGCVYRMLSEAGKADPLGHYEDWLKLEDSFGFRSTFYFVAPSIKPQHGLDPDYRLSDPVTYDGRRMTAAEMMREIDTAGFEIGMHGSIESARTPGMLTYQKTQIEDALGHEIRSTRQHYLMYDAQITPALQSEAGFTSDSTMGFARALGFRAGTSLPHWCWDWSQDRKLPLMEVPLAIMDVNLFGCSVEEAVGKCISVMDAVERVGGCLTLNWHPNYINGPMWEVYSAVLQEANRRGAWGRGASEICDWWAAREQRLCSWQP